jgi:peptidoglycan hydrolase CwlO-like protein
MSLANSRFDGPPATTTTGPSSDDTRDRIINTYREEIKNHQARERDFKILQEVIADLQRKVRGLENEIGSCQRDHEDRIREQNKVINNLGGDLEQVKRSIQDNQAEGIQVFD